MENRQDYIINLESGEKIDLKPIINATKDATELLDSAAKSYVEMLHALTTSGSDLDRIAKDIVKGFMLGFDREVRRFHVKHDEQLKQFYLKLSSNPDFKN